MGSYRVLVAVAPIGDLPTSLIAAIAGVVVVLAAWIAYRRCAYWKREAAKCRTTLDSVAGPVLVLDADLRVVDRNRAARRTLGSGRKGARGETLLSLVESDGDLAVDRLLKEIEQNGQAVFDGHGRKGGPSAGARVRLSSMEVDGRQRLVAYVEDVSEERAQAAQYEAFLDHLIEHVPVEVTILSPDGRYLYLSSSFIADERQREWLIGKTDFDYCRESGIHVELALRRRSHRMEAIDRRETVFFEEETTIDGSERKLAWRYCPFRSEEGEVSMILGFGVDQTELVGYRSDLHAAREEVRKVSRLKEALLQNVSHEVRTPLSGIIATAQMLKTEVPLEIRDFLDNIEENGHRLAETLNGMLDLAGLQAENLEIRPEILNLSAEIEEVARTVRSTVDRRGLFLKDAASHPEILVRADRGALLRCVKSLVDNAVKFTSEGGILLDATTSGEYAYIRVMDTGVGIDEDVQGDVFDAFSQEDAGTDREFEGVGLGLTVTKRLLAMMDGDIRVHSRKGAGSSFVVRLPLVMSDVGRRTGTRPRVLIADSQREAHRMIHHMLSDYFEFDSAHSLAEAAALSGQREFDAVFVDVRLDAEMDSIEMLRAFREGPSFQSAALVLVDDHRVPGRRSEALGEGWDAYVAKPLQKLELLNALYAHTRRAVPVA